jgi:hypothetical protein
LSFGDGTRAGFLATGVGGISLGSSSSDPLNLITGGSTRIAVTAAGSVSVNAPTSGNALTVNAFGNGLVVNGASGNYTTTVQTAALSSGNSFGLHIQAGTNASDESILVQSQGGTNYFQVRGDGLAQAIDQGGALQDVGWRGTPLNSQSTNYTPVLADRGKTIQCTASLTITLPTAVFSGGDVITIEADAGTTITISTGGTLRWAGNGSTTGTRTLTGSGLATVLYLTSSVAVISGAGLT